VLGRRGDRLKALFGVLEAAPDALQVEDAEAAELARQGSGLGRDHTVHGGGEQGQVKAVRTERPGDVDVVRVPRAA
jgi:hypothetical protein